MNTFLFRQPGWIHTVNGSPCEDAVAKATSKSGRASAIALCDGASCASYGKMGAEALSKRIASYISSNFEMLIHMDNNLVVKALADQVCSVLEGLAAEFQISSDSFSSTMMAVATNGLQYLYAHLGDGIIIGRRMRRHLFPISEPFCGEQVHSTWLTSTRVDELVGTIRVGKGSMDGIDAFLMTSDGAEAALYSYDRTGEPGDKVKLSRTINAIISAAVRPAVLRENITLLAKRINAGDDLSIAILHVGSDTELEHFGYNPDHHDLRARRIARGYKRYYDALRAGGSKRTAARSAGWRKRDAVRRVRRFETTFTQSA